MKIDSKTKNILYVLCTNGINLVFGIVTSIVIPTMLSINDYALFRTYLLYVGYVGLLSMGFNDGLYVKYGNLDYKDIPFNKFITLLKYLVFFQVILSTLLFIIILVFFENNYKYVFITFLICISSIILNIDTFFNFINQFTRRFNISLYNNILSKVFIIVSLLFINIIKKDNYITYSIVFMISYFIILLSNIVRNKEVIGAKSASFLSIKNESIDLVKRGFFLMIGSYFALLILGVSQISVQKLFSISDFAMFIFALSILNIVYLIINAVSTVFFPYLSRVDKNNIKNIYLKTEVFLTIATSLFFTCFFIIKILIRTFLNEYIDSLNIMAILFPITLYNSIFNVLSFNYYKIIGNQKDLIKSNLTVLLISSINIVIFYILYKSLIIISFITLLNHMIWIIYIDKKFKDKLRLNFSYLHIKQIIICIIFLYCALNFTWSKGLVVYTLLYIVFTFLFFKKDIEKMVKLKYKYFTSI